LVFEELRRIVVEIEMPELDRFIELRRKMNDVMMQLLEECRLPTNKMVKNLVVVQDAYINTYHPDFMGGANSVFNMFDQEK
jgi:dynamin 1-like protein|tara:strand:- start:715 stop:957 length:243 start_codon:yes stop_codon:yes gene_type:complete